MKIIFNNNINLAKWEYLIHKSEFSSPFQTPEFYKFYNSVDGFSADVFAIEKNSEYTSLVVVTIEGEKGIKSFFSKRGIIYGGPLLHQNNEKALEQTLNYISDFYKKKLIYLKSEIILISVVIKMSFNSINFYINLISTFN